LEVSSRSISRPNIITTRIMFHIFLQSFIQGFAWSLRLRALMEETSNLQEAVSFWQATQNTMGLNHGIGSAADNSFLALETKVRYFVTQQKHFFFVEVS
jgi:hypothetical protein